MDAKKIALDVVKFGKTADEESTRFMRSNEMRLNENFRKLKEVSESIMADFGDYYPKSEVDALLAGKANVSHTHSAYMPKTGGTFSGAVTFQGAINNPQGDLAGTGQNYYPTPSAVTVPTSTYTDVASVTLGVGKWILLLSVRFAKDGTGYRYCRLSSTSGSGGSNFSMSANDMRPAFADEVTFTKAFDLVSNTSSRTLYLQAWQNSGTSLSCMGRIIAIRIC